MNKRIVSFTSDIHQAALVGDLAALQRSIDSGVDINLAIDRLPPTDYFCLRQLTPLMVAAMSSQGATVETVKWLVEHGADLNLKSAAEHPVVWYALAFWYVDDEDNLQIDRTNANLILEQSKRLRCLLDVSAEINLQWLFCEACRYGAVNAVALLLEYGASPIPSELVPRELIKNDRDSRWLNYADVPIVLAAKSGIVECIQLLLDAGADPNSYNNLGETPLRVATTPAVVKLLISVGADVHANDKYSDDIFAECHPDRQILEMLLAAGVDIEARNKYGWTRLYRAAFNGDLFRVEFLLAHGAKIEGCNAKDLLDTPLHALCFCSSCVPIIDSRSVGVASRAEKTLCERLLDAGIDIDCQNSKGNTPLLTAASQSYGCGSSDGALPVLVAAFIARGANVNLSNHRGETPLIATVKGSLFYLQEFECFKLLVAAGANLYHRDLDGKTAIDYFREIASICSRIEDEEILSYWETLDRMASEIDYDI